MEYYKRIIKESFIIVIVSSLIGLISGSVLSFNQGVFYSIPIILLILPSMNSLIGDISTVLVSRLTTHLYIGTLAPEIRRSERLKEDFLGLLLTILLSLGALILLGYGLGIATQIEIVNPLLVILVVSIDILFIFLILFVFLFISAVLLFKRGKDPNNALIPIVTSLADFLTPLLLIILIQIFI